MSSSVDDAFGREQDEPRTTAAPRRRGLRDPLVHYILLGALAFGGVTLARRAGEGSADDVGAAKEAEGLLGPHLVDRRIVVTSAVQASLAEQFERGAGRPWNPEEREAAIERWIDEEVLVRAGRSRGLHLGDPVIRRRLVQHVGFVHESAIPLPEPDDATLQAYLDAHPDRYRGEVRYDLEEVLVSKEAFDDPQLSAASFVARLEAGERPVDLPSGVKHGKAEGVTHDRIEAVRGPAFANALAAAEINIWTTYAQDGSYELFRISNFVAEGDIPPLATVRDQVRKDWESAERKRLRAEALHDLRSRATIIRP